MDPALLARIDHLVYATADVEATSAELEARLGVAATPGGRHPGRGTYNALFALGPRSYLEVIGPDPGQPAPAAPRWFGIDALTDARLVTWAAKTAELEELIAGAARRGVRLGAVAARSRVQPDGKWLSWQLTDPATVIAEGVVPFFIDWSDRPHPADSLPTGLALAGLKAEHPDAAAVRRILAVLDLALTVDDGPRPALIATLDGPRGRSELR